ncbi:Nn.00g071720.m01.CDS01 [Neocucurbitaria sp. VM-36]
MESGPPASCRMRHPQYIFDLLDLLTDDRDMCLHIMDLAHEKHAVHLSESLRVIKAMEDELRTLTARHLQELSAPESRKKSPVTPPQAAPDSHVAPSSALSFRLKQHLSASESTEKLHAASSTDSLEVHVATSPALSSNFSQSVSTAESHEEIPALSLTSHGKLPVAFFESPPGWSGPPMELTFPQVQWDEFPPALRGIIHLAVVNMDAAKEAYGDLTYEDLPNVSLQQLQEAANPSAASPACEEDMLERLSKYKYFSESKCSWLRLPSFNAGVIDLYANKSIPLPTVAIFPAEYAESLKVPRRMDRLHIAPFPYIPKHYPVDGVAHGQDFEVTPAIWQKCRQFYESYRAHHDLENGMFDYADEDWQSPSFGDVLFGRFFPLATRGPRAPLLLTCVDISSTR